jgi:hypothetical protein
VFSEINRILKVGDRLTFTTLNIASLFRRLRLLLGMQPQYRLHVREYTKKEVEDLLINHGFKIINGYYSIIDDLTYLDCEIDECLKLSSYTSLFKHVFNKPTKTNILRLLAYPILSAIPSLRQLIVVIAKKIAELKSSSVERWG